MEKFVSKVWYSKSYWAWLLFPCSLIYQIIVTIRRKYLQHIQQHHIVPIIVIGNLTVGGVGKTPLVIALALKLRAKGLRVGIVSRGYGAKVCHYPYEVMAADPATMVGDEPLLLAKKTCSPVVISPVRMAAVRYLLDKYDSQVIISDDGLQHYAMGRAVEILVVDGQRGLGNGLCLPAGPLREGKKRLQEVDFIVVNSGYWPQAYEMTLAVGKPCSIKTGSMVSWSQLHGQVAAVAAIGNPERFFTTLKTRGISFTPYAFPDHHVFQPWELNLTEKIIVMTEKDAVKCNDFATETMYFVPVEANLSDSFWNALWSHPELKGLFI
ncbi:MAG: tetraacyldisaccharide 4'-kinase [Legionella sp.]